MGMRFVTSGAMDARQAKMDFAVMRKGKTMRLIDKDALLNIFSRYYGNDKIEVDEVIEWIDEQPTIEDRKWIPCSERLPEVHESGNSFSGIYMQSNPVLVYGTCEYEDNAQFHVVTYCDDLDGNTYWSTELDAITVSGVIAWMPLPEPYREEATNETP